MDLKINQWLKKIDILESQIYSIPQYIKSGCLVGIKGIVLEVKGIYLPIGSTCFIDKLYSNQDVKKQCEVVGFKDNIMFIIPLDGIVDGLCYGDRVFFNYSVDITIKKLKKQVPLGSNVLGRILDGYGNPLDKHGAVCVNTYDDTLSAKTINPLQRKPIKKILDLGIRSINSFLTVGLGQRIGLFSGSGVGKSVLLGMIAKYSVADVVIVALIGERGREVKDFIENILGKEGLNHSVVIAAPADTSALSKVQGALYATRLAEYFRDKNKNVLLIMDSLTRYAMSLRDISLSLGELPVIKGYPSSVFSMLPNLIERSGNSNLNNGSISAIYTVLTEQDEINDPVSDIAKSVLDGHIVLSRALADLGHYPAIDISSSISRVMTNLVTVEHVNKSLFLKQLISIYKKNEDLINMGAYVKGCNVLLDKAVKYKIYLDKFLQQDMLSNISFNDSYMQLEKLFNDVNTNR
ncbi:MAG: FliI/YscN family ATPase [Buchnera aphidicola (Eriosoma harunire)]